MKRIKAMILGAIFGSATALAALTVPAAVSWATEQKILITATVAKFCVFRSVSDYSELQNATALPSNSGALNGGQSTVTITDGVDAGAVMKNFGFTFSATATCNTPSSFHLESLGNGLKDRGAQPHLTDGLLSVINYSASGRWNNGPTAGLTTTGGSGPLSSPSSMFPTPVTGSIVVDVKAVMNTSAPIAAGTYGDTLRVMLAPQ